MGLRKTGGEGAADQAAGYRRRMLKDYFLRFHMGLILCAVSAAGVLSSRLLLFAGIESVLLRYPLAVLGAYLVFFAMIRLWIEYVRPPAAPVSRPRSSDLDDLVDLDLIDVSLPEAGGGRVHFAGGDSGGGGASSAWGSSSGGAGSSSGSASSLDLDEGIWILVALAALIAVVFGSGVYLVYVAPEILPEVAVHAAVASGLIRTSRKLEAQGWMSSLFRASVVPFLLVVAAAAALGYAVHSACPSAVKLADAFHCKP